MTYLIGLSSLLSFFLGYLLLKYSNIFNIIDIPNQRSMHVNPTPRSGGIGFILAILVCFAILIPLAPILLLISSLTLLVFLLSLLDDVFDLSAIIRLCVHLACVSILLIVLNYYHVLSFGVFFSVFIVLLGAWFINLFNFMDGLDGLCALTIQIGFMALGVLSLIHHESVFALASFIVATALISFNFFNWPKAYVFMGDCGSATLGFLVFAFILWGFNRHLFNLIQGVTLFSPFLFDATITLGKRLAKKEKVWQAHRSHYYQRMKASGISNEKILFIYGSFMLFSFVSVLLATYFDVETAISYPYGLYICLAIYFDRGSQGESHVKCSAEA